MDIEAIRKQVEQQVMQYFHLEPTVTDAPYAGMVTGVDVISHLEHSLLNPDTTLETIERECAVARKYSVAAVCVAPYYVPAAREILLGSPVAVGTAIGFPHGCMSQAAKLVSVHSAIESDFHVCLLNRKCLGFCMRSQCAYRGLIFLLYRRKQLVGTVKAAAAEGFRQSTGRDVQCIEAEVLADALQGVSGTECCRGILLFQRLFQVPEAVVLQKFQSKAADEVCAGQTLRHALVIAANGCIYLFQRHFYTSPKNSFVKENSFFRGRRGIGLSLLREPAFYVAQAFQQQRIESAVLSGGQLSDRFLLREGRVLVPLAGQTVIGIRQRYHLCCDGDVIALPAIGIAAAVPALMVPAADLDRKFHQRLVLILGNLIL